MLEGRNPGQRNGTIRFFAGDSIGEASLLGKALSPVTLVAVMTTEVLELKRANMDYVLQEFPLLRKQLYENYARNL
jgi:CRP-like cAMP-binding protein